MKLARKEAMGDYSHLKNKKGELIAKPLPQPTLPNLSVDDDDDRSSINTRAPPASTYTTQDYYYYNSDKSQADYPPMPAYNPYSTHQPPGSYAQFNPSAATLGQDEYTYPQPMYEEDNESTAHLAMAAAPFAQAPIDRPGSALPNPHSSTLSSNYDPHDVYQGRAIPSGQVPRRTPPSSALARPSSGLAYDDVQDYPSPVSGGHNPQYSSQPQYQSFQTQDVYGGQPQHHQQRSGGRGYDEERGAAY